MDTQFLVELDNYQSNPRLYLNDFYSYMYMNLSNFNDVEEDLLKLKEEAISNNDNLLLSLYNYSKYLTMYSTKLESAISYLKEALSIIEKENNYKQYDLYFAIILSFSLSYNQTNQMEKSLRLTKDAISYLAKTNNLNFLIQFVINLSYIYSEMRLKREALDILLPYDPEFKYLYPNLRRHLLSALIVHSLSLKMPEHILEYIKTLEADPKYQSGYHKSLVDCYYMNYYMMLDNMDMASNFYSRIKESYQDITKFINHPGPSNRTTLFISVARYLKKIGNLEGSFDFYKYVVSNIEQYIGERIQILDEATELAFELKQYDKAHEFFRTLKEYSNDYEEVLYNVINLKNESEKDERIIAINGYNRIIQHINLVNSFFKDMFKATELSQINDDLLTLIKRFSPESNAKILYNIEGKIYYYNKKGDLVKVIGMHDVDKYKMKLMNTLPLNLKLQFPECNYITSFVSNNQTVGFLVYDNNLFNSFDDSSKPLGEEALNAAGDAIYRLFKFKKINQDALIDELTKALNRYALSDFVNTYNFESPLYFVELDLDDFKKINDTYGHPCGDFVLRGIAQKLQKHFGKDYVYRIGGEEFVVICSLTKEKLNKKLEKIKNELKNVAFKYNDNDIFVSVSYGGTSFKNKKEYDQAYRRADQLLYEIKHKTKGNGIIE